MEEGRGGESEKRVDKRVLGLTVLGWTFGGGCNHKMDIMTTNDCTLLTMIVYSKTYIQLSTYFSFKKCALSPFS